MVIPSIYYRGPVKELKHIAHQMNQYTFRIRLISTFFLSIHVFEGINQLFWYILFLTEKSRIDIIDYGAINKNNKLSIK